MDGIQDSTAEFCREKSPKRGLNFYIRGKTAKLRRGLVSLLLRIGQLSGRFIC
jgi:hypothetical protein